MEILNLVILKSVRGSFDLFENFSKNNGITEPLLPITFPYLTTEKFIFLLPLILFQMAILGLGVGILIASLTTKYKDLTFLMTFGVQLWMFATPVVYPLSIVPENYRILIILNPMTSIVEIFKKIFLGQSSIELHHVLISIIITLFIFFLGLFNFGKMEKNFMDTI